MRMRMKMKMKKMVTNMYAVSCRYGTPEDFKHLVDEDHEDDIEQGMINAFLDAFESGSFWPCSLYYSGKGRDIMSPKLWEVLGLVVRSMGSGSSPIVSGEGEDEGFVSEVKTQRTVVLGLKCHDETTPKPTPVDELGFQGTQLGEKEELGFGSGSGSSIAFLNKPSSVGKPPTGSYLSPFRRRQGLPNKITCDDDDENVESPL